MLDDALMPAFIHELSLLGLTYKSDTFSTILNLLHLIDTFMGNPMI